MFKWIEKIKKSKRIKFFLFISVEIILLIYVICLKIVPPTSFIKEKPSNSYLADSTFYSIDTIKFFLLKKNGLDPNSYDYDRYNYNMSCVGKMLPLNNYDLFESTCDDDDGIKAKFLLFEKNLYAYFYKNGEMFFVKDNNLIKVDNEGNFISEVEVKNKKDLYNITRVKLERVIDGYAGDITFLESTYPNKKNTFNKDDKKNFKINFSKKQNLNVFYNDDKKIVAGGYVVKEERYYTYYDDIDVREEEIDRIYKNFNIYFISPSKDKIIEKISIRNKNYYNDYSYYIKDNYLYVTLKNISKLDEYSSFYKLDLALYKFDLATMSLKDSYSKQFTILHDHYYLNKNILIAEDYEIESKISKIEEKINNDIENDNLNNEEVSNEEVDDEVDVENDDDSDEDTEDDDWFDDESGINKGRKIIAFYDLGF